MNKIFLFFLTCMVVLSSCQSDNSSNNNDTTAVLDVQLKCELISADEDVPKAAIYALVRENKVKIGEVITDDCKVIEADDYANFKIPADALTAAGGWWAGAGDYYYILEAENEYVVMKGRLEEMMEGDMEYRRVAGLRK